MNHLKPFMLFLDKYLCHTPPKIYVRLTDLEVGKEYNVKVYAVNSYGVSSTKPLEIKICN